MAVAPPFTPQRLTEQPILTATRTDGMVVAASPFDRGVALHRKLLIVLNYYEGDKATAEELCELIADIERIKIREADIMLYRRHDASEPSRRIIEKLQEKFEKVHLLKCRRTDGNDYPFSSNQMFYDLVTALGQQREWAQQYYAFLNLEPDCVPTRPGWISELIAGFLEAQKHGFSAIGFIHNDPFRHMNGVAVYDIGIYNKVPGNRLSGGPPMVTYDIAQARNLSPLCEDTPLIHFDYRRPTIMPEDLFSAKRDGTEPCLYHGVKDRSARDAVREKFITFSAHRSAVNRNVFTFHHAVRVIPDGEAQYILKLWQDGWRSRGWNPIVLRNTDAVRNRRYREVLDAISKFPTKADAETHNARFMRWLALDTMAGSFLTDYDVLPGDFTPDIAENSRGFAVVDGQITAAIMDRPTLGGWITEIRNYAPVPEDEGNVTDASVYRFMLGERRVGEPAGLDVTQFAGGKMKGAAMVHFSKRAIEHTPVRTKRKSELMEDFLRG
jgi:hypothetical protein